MWLWNVSSRHISSIVAGRILCLETIFALPTVMHWMRDPQVFELLGICLIVFGISGSARLRMSKSGSMRHA
jgi:drug/metabolite transporter (DMT)-like permease